MLMDLNHSKFIKKNFIADTFKDIYQVYWLFSVLILWILQSYSLTLLYLVFVFSCDTSKNYSWIITSGKLATLFTFSVIYEIQRSIDPGNQKNIIYTIRKPIRLPQQRESVTSLINISGWELFYSFIICCCYCCCLFSSSYQSI